MRGTEALRKGEALGWEGMEGGWTAAMLGRKGLRDAMRSRVSQKDPAWTWGGQERGDWMKTGSFA
jgi:hypothetical protein